MSVIPLFESAALYNYPLGRLWDTAKKDRYTVVIGPIKNSEAADALTIRHNLGRISRHDAQICFCEDSESPLLIRIRDSICSRLQRRNTESICMYSYMLYRDSKALYAPAMTINATMLAQANTKNMLPSPASPCLRACCNGRNVAPYD